MVIIISYERNEGGRSKSTVNCLLASTEDAADVGRGTYSGPKTFWRGTLLLSMVDTSSPHARWSRVETAKQNAQSISFLSHIHARRLWQLVVDVDRLCIAVPEIREPNRLPLRKFGQVGKVLGDLANRIGEKPNGTVFRGSGHSTPRQSQNPGFLEAVVKRSLVGLVLTSDSRLSRKLKCSRCAFANGDQKPRRCG
jgi:hypothetical protein